MLSPNAFGVAMGSVFAAYMALLAWTAPVSTERKEGFGVASKFYPGYEPGFTGGLIGAVYGFALGFGMGWGLAWIYNAIAETRPTAKSTFQRVVREPVGGLLRR